MKKQFEVKAWGYVDKETGKLHEASCTKYKHISNSEVAVELTGSYEIPEQEITITEAEFDEAWEKMWYAASAGEGKIILKNALGFK